MHAKINFAALTRPADPVFSEGLVELRKPVSLHDVIVVAPPMKSNGKSGCTNEPIGGAVNRLKSVLLKLHSPMKQDNFQTKTIILN